jgi:hypothetical protein
MLVCLIREHPALICLVREYKRNLCSLFYIVCFKGTGSFGASASTTYNRVGTKDIQYREEQDATAQAKICCITFLPEINQQKVI